MIRSSAWPAPRAVHARASSGRTIGSSSTWSGSRAPSTRANLRRRRRRNLTRRNSEAAGVGEQRPGELLRTQGGDLAFLSAEAQMHGIAARAALVGLLTLRQLGLGPHVKEVPKAAELEQFWAAPAQVSRLDLLAGPSSSDLRPPETARPFAFISRKTSGFSPGYDVRDASGREWSVKLGPEAQSEVVVSRLLWALGYHQPPTYYVDRWTLEGGPEAGLQTGGRFRPKDDSLKSKGDWSWQHNPFVNSPAYQGLIVAMALLNSTDLRNENNTIYDVKTAGHRQRWYVVKDLGAALGETGVYRPTRNDIDAFESEPLFTVDSHGH